MGGGSRGTGDQVWGEPQGPKGGRRNRVQGKMQEMMTTGRRQKTQSRENKETEQTADGNKEGNDSKVEKQRQAGQRDPEWETESGKRSRETEGEGHTGGGGEGGEGEERRVMWRDLALESGAGSSNVAKCRLRKSEWTLLAFADGSKLFVATRDLSPTIFHFKEKWKQLFDLGILRGATGRGGERGERSMGKVGRSGPSKIKEQRPREGCGRGWGQAAENRGMSETEGACVCVCVSSLPLCLSPHGLGFVVRR